MPDLSFSHTAPEDWFLVECDALSLAVWFPMFWSIIAPSSSGSGSLLGRLDPDREGTAILQTFRSYALNNSVTSQINLSFKKIMAEWCFEIQITYALLLIKSFYIYSIQYIICIYNMFILFRCTSGFNKPWRRGFDPRLVHVWFVVDKVALGQVPPSTSVFCCQYHFTNVPYSYSS
jgi:hypothetical protein